MDRAGGSGCGCLQLGRRALLGGIAGLGLAATWRARPAGAQETSPYEAMLLACIDPRFVDPVHAYMTGRSLSGKYSQFNIAGAAIGVVAPKFAGWHQAFWDNLATSLTLHRITAVIAIDHRDCGAARVAYGAASIATSEAETRLHRDVFGRFRGELARRHPAVTVETWLMARDGTVEALDSGPGVGGHQDRPVAQLRRHRF